MNYALDAIWWRLRHPAVRDLAALLTAPPLWHSGCELPIPRLLGSQGFRFLLSLDDAPAPLTQWLEQEAPFGHRLGHYAESLLAFWLARAPHCQLIARNHPVRSESGQTLGAADFLCLLDSTPYHLELTCKYYGGTAPDDFQGLNPADTNCTADAVTIYAVKAGGRSDGPTYGHFELRYSPKCHSNWVRFTRWSGVRTYLDEMTGGTVQETLWIWRQGVANSLRGTAHTETWPNGNSEWSEMVTADGVTCSSVEFYYTEKKQFGGGARRSEGTFNAPCLS